MTSLPFTLREGVPILWGAGLGAFVAPGRIAGDCKLFSAQSCKEKKPEDSQQVGQESHQS